MASDAGTGRPSLRQFAIFDAVVRHGSIGGAAQMLGLSQPAASHSVAQLERLFGTVLVSRGTDGSMPTASGAILHRRVVRLREQIIAALAAICGLPPDSDAVRQRLAALSSTQVAGHLAIAAQGSFRAAASRLAISEPAIQRTARALEAMVGVALYAPSRQQIGVNAAGRTLAASLQRGLAEIEQARDEIEALQGVSSGRITLGCLPLMPKSMLAAVLGQLLTRYPNVQVSLEEGAYDRLVVDLKHGRLNMLLGALRHDEDPDEIDSLPLFDDPYLIVARAEHPLVGQRRRITRTLLAAQSWVVPPVNTPRRTALEALFTSFARRPRIVLETASVAMTMETLTRSDCLSLSCRSQMNTDFADARLGIVDVSPIAEQRRIGISLRSDWLPTSVQKAFIELATTMFSDTSDCKPDIRLPNKG